jgi:hypothetical protein
MKRESFCERQLQKKEKTIVSTDGGLEIPTTLAVARKPGQRKRVRSGRTRTIGQAKRTKLTCRFITVYFKNIFRVDIQLYQHEWELGKREIIYVNLFIYFGFPQKQPCIHTNNYKNTMKVCICLLLVFVSLLSVIVCLLSR